MQHAAKERYSVSLHIIEMVALPFALFQTQHATINNPTHTRLISCYEFAATHGFIFYNATRRAGSATGPAEPAGTFVFQRQSLSLTVQDQLQDYTLLASLTNGDSRLPIFTDTSADSYAMTGDHTCRQIWRSLNPSKAGSTSTKGPYGYVVLDSEACGASKSLSWKAFFAKMV